MGQKAVGGPDALGSEFQVGISDRPRANGTVGWACIPLSRLIIGLSRLVIGLPRLSQETALEDGGLLAEDLEAMAGGLHHKDPALIIYLYRYRPLE